MSDVSANHFEDAPVMSVRDVLERRDEPNGWQLALVQRDEVWDNVRTRQLLDSLLRGYPIGALLLGRVHEDAMNKSGELVSDHDWLVLDGQQRMKALDDLFHSGNYYLRLTSSLPQPQPRTARTNKARGLEHIHFDKDGSGPPEPAGTWLSLARFSKYMETAPPGEPRAIRSTDLDQVQDTLGITIDGEDHPTAELILGALTEAWQGKRIPVLRVAIRSAMDVLEVFTRVNMAGVNVTGADVYFAGVKTFWPAAEASLARFADQAAPPFLEDRQATLRFVSRLAAVGIGQADTLPLAVDRLAGSRGQDLRHAMQELTSDDSPVSRRIANFTTWFKTSSDLEYALRLVHPDLFDIVTAWAAANSRFDGPWQPSADEAHTIDTFLLGASLFSYPSVLGDPFRRKAFREALAAGARGDAFPLGTILEAARPMTEGRGRLVRKLDTDESKVDLANSNGPLLVALIQRIKFDLEEHEQFDWDHIFPHSHGTRMQIPGGRGRRVHHKHRHLINAPGNLWALDYSLNRSLKATVGQAKVDQLDEWRAAPSDKFRVLDMSGVSVTPKEMAMFVEVDRLLDGETEHVNEAMEIFRSLVRSRMQRLLEDAIERFPGLPLFASNADIDAVDDTGARRSYAVPLGLLDPYANLRGATAKEARKTMRRRSSALADLASRTLGGQLDLTRKWSGVNASNVAWAAIQVDGGNCSEIITRWAPETGAVLQFKAYRTFGKPNRLYPEFDHIPLGVEWDAPDAEVAEAFLRIAAEVDSRYPVGEPSGGRRA